MHDPNHSITTADAAAAATAETDDNDLRALVQQEVRAELERARQARAQQAPQQQQRPQAPPSGLTITGDVAKLATALAAAQSEFEPILKTKTATVQGTTKSGSSYKYNFDFAPLDEVKAKTMPALNRHGFAVLEPFYQADARNYEMGVVLLHAAGEISCRIRFEDPGDIQKVGSAQTYRRRYMYTSLIGCVAESDDDSNAADGNEANIQSHPVEPRRQAPPQAVSKAAQDQARPQQKPAPQSHAAGPPAASATVEAIQAEGRRLGLKGPALAANAKTYIGCTPDRLDLEGGEALAQQWLTALRAQKTAGEVEAK